MEPTKEPVNGPMNESMNESVNEPMNEPVNLIARMEAKVMRDRVRTLESLIQKELDGHRPDCPECGRPMAKNHSYRRAVESSWGKIEVTIPVYRCRQCAVMVSNAWMLRG